MGSKFPRDTGKAACESLGRAAKQSWKSERVPGLRGASCRARTLQPTGQILPWFAACLGRVSSARASARPLRSVVRPHSRRRWEVGWPSSESRHGLPGLCVRSGPRGARGDPGLPEPLARVSSEFQKKKSHRDTVPLPPRHIRRTCGTRFARTPSLIWETGAITTPGEPSGRRAIVLK
jgi:hypothetical protein